MLILVHRSTAVIFDEILINSLGQSEMPSFVSTFHIWVLSRTGGSVPLSVIKLML